MKGKINTCAAEKSFTTGQNHTPYPDSTLSLHQNKEITTEHEPIESSLEFVKDLTLRLAIKFVR